MKMKVGAVETSPKRVRAVKNGKVVADSLAPRLVWENPFYPNYFFPEADVDFDAIDESDVHRPAADEPGGGRNTAHHRTFVAVAVDSLVRWLESCLADVSAGMVTVSHSYRRRSKEA